MDAGRPVIVEVWDGLYGPGFYALDIGYEDATRDQLRWECFGDARPEHPMDGVLVVDPSLADMPFESMDGHILADGGFVGIARADRGHDRGGLHVGGWRVAGR